MTREDIDMCEYLRIWGPPEAADRIEALSAEVEQNAAIAIRALKRATLAEEWRDHDKTRAEAAESEVAQLREALFAALAAIELSPTPVDASQTSDPTVKADALGAEWMRREIIRHCEDGWPNDEGQNVYFSGGDGIAHKIKTTIPGPTDADLDAATLARPKVKALIEALTPSGDTKAAYMGEIIDPETKRTVSWTAIKMVMKMIAERAAAKGGDA